MNGSLGGWTLNMQANVYYGLFVLFIVRKTKTDSKSFTWWSAMQRIPYMFLCLWGRKWRLKEDTCNKDNYHYLSLFWSDLREAVTKLRSAEVNAVSGVLKLYFRELPEPLIPTELFQSLSRSLGKTTHPQYITKHMHTVCILHWSLALNL